jgi:biopolymer transport protein ExbD
MGAPSRNQNQAITGINVTPLVDITLVLLIIFMVTAKLVISRAIPVDLPAAATGGEVQYVFSVALFTDGTVTVNGAPAPQDGEFLRSAREALAAHPDLRAIVQADGAVPHRQVMHALDLLRQAGISRVAFGVNPAPPVEDGAAR